MFKNLNYSHKNFIAWVMLCGVCFLFSGCQSLKTTGHVLSTTGKVGWKTAKITGKVAKTTGKAAWATSKVTAKGVRTAAYMAKGKEIIPLEKQGNSLYATVKLNKKAYAKFLVDTGASQMQISRAMASRLGIRMDQAEETMVSLAGGHLMTARMVTLKEVKVGGARVKNIKAIVLDSDNMGMRDGLLGMSFLNHFIFQMNAKKGELILQRRVVQ